MLRRRPRREPGVRVRLVGVGADRRDIVEVDRPPVEHADHEPRDIFPVAEERARLHRDF